MAVPHENSPTPATLWRWAILMGLTVFAFAVAGHQGLLGTLLANDPSYLSVIIIGIFAATSASAGRNAWQLDRALLTVRQLCASARRETGLIALTETDEILIDGASAEASAAHYHLAQLAHRYKVGAGPDTQGVLYDRLDQIIRQDYEGGWFIADLMVRLGLLGTVIGFILMLGTVTSITSTDLGALQQLLQGMSGGMRVALYTTLCGLGAGLLLSFQYRILDRSAHDLYALTVELCEVHAVAQLQAFARVHTHSPQADATTR